VLLPIERAEAINVPWFAKDLDRRFELRVQQVFTLAA